MQRVRAFGCFDGQVHTRIGLRHARDLVFPTQVDIGFLARLLVQIAFGVVLLQVDEGGAAMAGLG
ncbi:hypothetical protein D3C86_2060860 [compost metagenome]